MVEPTNPRFLVTPSVDGHAHNGSSRSLSIAPNTCGSRQMEGYQIHEKPNLSVAEETQWIADLGQNA
jgi:hypothetical protein